VDRRRLVLLSVAVLLIPVGLAVRMLPGVVGDVAGGLLYVGLVYVLCSFVVPRARPVVLGVVAAVIGVGVELLQLTGLPGAVAGVVPVARYILGSTFAVGDLAVAVVGAVVAAFVDSRVRRRRTPSRYPDSAARR